MRNNKYFLVLGGSGGLGGALSVKLAEKGFIPIITYCARREPATRLARQTGGIALSLDMSQRESILSACGEIEHLQGNLCGVVLSASPLPNIVPFGKISETDMERQWQVNVKGVQCLLAELVRRCFRKNATGCVVGVLSEAMGKGIGSAMPNMGAYTISKYGMLGVLATAAADYRWLQVLSVSPGYMDTPMLNAFDERFIDMQQSRGLISSCSDVANSIVGMIESLKKNDYLT